MPEKLVENIVGMLNEEKWTRVTLNDYAVRNFQTLDSLIEQILAENHQDEIKNLCEEHLEHTKNSFAALYISGIISLSKHQVDDTHLLHLINIFADNQKWSAVQYLCQRILDFGENKDALKILAETLEHLNLPQNMHDVWERLIKVDFSETDIVKRLAEIKEANDDLEGAVLYYRKAIHRYVNKNQYNHVKDTWKKLIELGVDDYEFFFLIEKKVAKSMSPDRAVNLLEALYPAIKKQEEWAVAIEVLKKILNYDGRNNWARLEIIECYKNRYTAHSQVDECIKLSNLNQNWRNVLEAIADFEKHISFDTGSFVFHNTWGVGIIKSIKDDRITIDFARKRAHGMSLKMAVGALQSLANDHIWVLKSLHVKEDLRLKVKKDIPWALKTIIRSFDNVADIKKIKSELVPTILSAGEWTTWSIQARNHLKTDPIFGNVPDQLDQFVVRDNPMSFEEKTFNQFKAEKSFFVKIQYAREFMDHSDRDSEFFGEVFSYFRAFLNSGLITPQLVASYLFLEKLSIDTPHLNPNLNWGFKELWADIEDPVEIFSQIEDADIRLYYLEAVHKHIEGWPEIYLNLFPIQLSDSMLKLLSESGYKENVIKKLEEIIEHYREYREGLIWIAQHAADNQWLSEFRLDISKILINMIRLLDLTFNEIDNRQDVSSNRKLNRRIQKYLFKEEKLKAFIADEDINFATRIFSLLEGINKLDPVLKRDLKDMVQNLFPDIKLYGEKQESESKITASSRYFYTTRSSLTAKQKELKHILEVEIPNNSKEIGIAIELGDLSENAEYKAGKEKQESLQLHVGRLKDEIERARLFPEKDRIAGKIGFGTVLILDDMVESREETYTILGPWESDPSAKTISYLSPFGRNLIGKSEGDFLEFVINDRNYKYSVKSVTPMTLSQEA